MFLSNRNKMTVIIGTSYQVSDKMQKKSISSEACKKHCEVLMKNHTLRRRPPERQYPSSIVIVQKGK